MPYLNVDTKYFNHPKTRRLTGLLGRGSEVLPLKLWCYCGDYHFKDGRLAGYSAQAIEDIVGWWGKAGEAVDGMMKTGFLEQVPDGFQVHDWLDHEGHILMLHEKAKAAANKRWSEHKGRCPPDAPGITQAIPKQCHAGGRLGMDGKAGTDPESERAREIVNATHEANARIERMRPKLLEMFCRKPNETISDYMDQQALCEISRRSECESEIAELIGFQKQPDSFFPQSLSKLLQTWAQTLDRARVRKKKPASNNQNGPQRKSLIDQEVDALTRQASRL